MNKSLEILNKYWGFPSFRDKQLDIINAVLDSKDTLALLPTGGGKSICYQIPGMVLDGVCIVVSPLIALMQDQVDNLNSKGIKAVAINAGMSKRQIDIQLDNAIYGSTKFLYVSPERLKNRLFIARFQKMNINLIAVDEAHCISQWGYDFRPAYLDISDLRRLKPEIPILALTATATSDVVDDIQEKLEFRDKNVIKQSFERSNLIYSTYLTDNKKNRIEEFVSQHTGSGIIYCSTRKGVKELSKYLIDKGVSIDFYHAGLDFEVRKSKQLSWLRGETRIIVSTNAFGMGIDKPDVRFVIHYDIPESIEAYFQEAGRAGRDEEKAEAILFYEAFDTIALKEKVELKFPRLDLIKQIYNALGNHFQLAIGAGEQESYPIDLQQFSEKYELNLLTVYNSLKFLELAGLIKLSEGLTMASKLKVVVNNTELYQEQVKDKVVNTIIQSILRTQMGVFDDYVSLNEFKISKITKIPISEISKRLNDLCGRKIIDYIPKSDKPKINYLTARLREADIFISPKFYSERKKIAFNKLNAVINYLESDSCRNLLLLNYFNDKTAKACGYCSTCVKKDKNNESKSLYNLVEAFVKIELKEKSEIQIIDLIVQFKEFPKNDVLKAIRWMSDHQLIKTDKQGKLITNN